jgi:uncharacterized membrane protein YhaH (DUF805 family)
LTTWAAFAVTFKRAHDRGYSGFISLLPGAVIAVTFFLGSIGGGGDLHVMLRQFNQVQRGIQITNSQLYSILLFGKICWYSVTLWLFIELWLRPGEACDNRFGPAKRRAVGAPLAN